MNARPVMVHKICYNVLGRQILLDKRIVDKYSDVVCPVSELLLTSLVDVLGQDCNDKILSARIETDMEMELGEYGESCCLL